jgi:hypothetical protein
MKRLPPLAIVLLAACGHSSGDGRPDLEKLRAKPGAAQTAREEASRACQPTGAPSDACCTALMEEGDALWAAADKKGALHAYQRTRSRCPRFAPVRRHLFLMKQPPAAPGVPESPGVDVRVSVVVDDRLDGIRLAWHESFLDGLAIPDGPMHTTVGKHELEVELYLDPRTPGEAPVRLDLAHEVEVPAALAGRTDGAGGATLRLTERPGASVTERVVTELTPRPFAPPRDWLKDLRRGGKPASPVVTPPGGPIDHSGQKLLPPNEGARLLLTPPDELLPPGIIKEGQVWGIFKVCVAADGTVESATVLKTPGPEIESDFVLAIRTWKYRPYLINRAPVRFCHPMRLEIRVR